jgi:peptide deformylase
MAGTRIGIPAAKEDGQSDAWLQEGFAFPWPNPLAKPLIRNGPEFTCEDMLSTAPDTIPILIAPDPILKAKAKPVGRADDDAIRDLAAKMLASMYLAPGLGLAAPQVGHSLRLITIDLMPDNKPAPMTLINPEIVALADEMATREEGCLSLPGQYAEVTRPARCKVRYLDLNGVRREVEADGLLNACLQHEIDHLDGILFVDHLSALKRNIIMRRLAKEQRQKRDDEKRR